MDHVDNMARDAAGRPAGAFARRCRRTLAYWLCAAALAPAIVPRYVFANGAGGTGGGGFTGVGVGGSGNASDSLGNGGGGGTTGSGSSGNNGTNATNGAGGAGGNSAFGTAGNGADGGTGLVGTPTIVLNGITVSGGGGGGGGFAAGTNAVGGNGGNGGVGIPANASPTDLTNVITVTGGGGGGGGEAVGSSGSNTGGNGGNGGTGVIANGNVSNSGLIAGGGGGGGGIGYPYSTNSIGGNGGTGGIGIQFVNAAEVSLNNTGTIQGGNGGGGATAAGMTSGAAGAGSAGVVGANLDITNDNGTIAGGVGGDGNRAAAIIFTGGANSLTLIGSSNPLLVTHWALTGNIQVNGGGSLAFLQDSAQSVANVITGDGSVIQDGTGVLTLTGNNTYSGGSTVNPGRVLQIGAGGTTGSLGIGGVNDNGTLVFNRGSALTVSNAISGTGAVQQTGAGIIVLTGGNSYQGITTISASILQIGAGGTTGSLGTGAIANNGILAFDRSDNGLTVSGAITGTGTVQQNGTGVTTLAGQNSYQGTTAILAGTLRAGAQNAFSSSSAFTVGANGTLDPGNIDQTLGSLAGAGNVTLGTSTLTVGGDNTSTTFSGGITGGAAGGLTKDGLGTLTLTGDNSYAGASKIVAGTLRIGAGGTTGSLGTGAVVNDGTLIFNRSDALTVSNTISGSGAVIQAGGIVTLTADNPYTGSTSIDAGTLALAGSGAIGQSSGVSVANDALLDISNLTNGGTTVNDLSGAGSVWLGANTLTVNATAATTFSGDISGTPVAGTPAASLVKTGSGSLTLSGAGSEVGAVTVSAGTLAFDQSGAFSTLAGYANNASTSIAGGARLLVGSQYTQSGTGSLNVVIGANDPAVTAQSAVLNGTLNITGYAGNQFTVIHTTGGITGDFSHVSIGGATSAVDYLTLTGTTVDTDYRVGMSLTWNAGPVQGGNGVFTLQGSAEAFDVGVALTDQAANAVTGWDGKSLTKQGQGKLTLSATNTYTGVTTISAGTLQIGNGGTAGSLGTGDVINNGILAFDRSDALIVGNAVSGQGAVEQNGTGVTTLAGNNTYTGATTINAGALVIASTGVIRSDVVNSAGFENFGMVAGSVTNNAGATYTQMDGSVSGGVINAGTVSANGGAINGAVVNDAGGGFTVGGVVTSDSTFENAAGAVLAVAGSGRYTLAGRLTNEGTATVAAGGALTAGGIVNLGTFTNDGTVTDDLVNAGLYSNNGIQNARVDANTGTIVNRAGAIWNGDFITAGTVANDGTINGGLTQAAGTTTNNGAINGAVLVSGGVFTGTGSSGALTIAGGAIFQPGSGTAGSGATVNGKLVLQPGATYRIDIDPATASQAYVNGDALLSGATVNAVYAPGSYIAKKYTILTATGGLGGSTFDAIIDTNLPSNFHDSLSYAADSVYLDLALNFGVPDTLQGNQLAVADTLTRYFNTTGGIPVAFGALSPAGLTQASGELATGVQRTSFDAMGQFLGVMADPAALAACDAVSPAARPGVRPAAGCETRRWTGWAAGYGSGRNVDGNSTVGSNDMSNHVWGVAVGGDYRFSPDTVAGVALGGGATSFRLGNGLGSGRSDLFQLGAFVHHDLGPAYVMGALAYGRQDVTTNRTISGPDGSQLRANYDANALSGRLESGWRFALPARASIAPYLAGQFSSVFLPGYGEKARSGASTFALDYASKTATDWRSEIGVRASKSLEIKGQELALGARLAWAHNFNPKPSVAASFQTLPGAGFVVQGASIGSDAALVGLSAQMKWRSGWALAASFDGALSGPGRSYGGNLTARYQW